MISDIDDMYMDIDIFSSPIADRSYYPEEKEYGLELTNTDYVDFQMLDSNAQPYSYENVSPKKMIEKQENVLFTPKPIPQICLTPKRKRRQQIFHPFESFDATELTVKSLKEGIKKRNQFPAFL